MHVRYDSCGGILTILRDLPPRVVPASKLESELFGI